MVAPDTKAIVAEGKLDERLPQSLDPESSLAGTEVSEETLVSELSAAPDGGLEAWLVATGEAFIPFCGLGFVNSFGIFREYYMSHQLRDKSADKTAWIGSLTSFLQFSVSALSRPLFDQYGVEVSDITPPPP